MDVNSMYVWECKNMDTLPYLYSTVLYVQYCTTLLHTYIRFEYVVHVHYSTVHCTCINVHALYMHCN